VFRLISENRFGGIEKKIEAAGINTDHDYKDLPDSDYWKIRDIVVQEYPAFRDITPGPPYSYSHKEDKVMTVVQQLLHRHLLQDVPVAGKFFIAMVWVAAVASPWLVEMDMSFFKKLGG
jgi:hypothetical protein